MRTLGEPGRPFERHSPFYVGLVGGLGLLTALLLESANDAAVTIATGVAGSRDANRFMARLGLGPHAVLRVAPTHVVRGKVEAQRPPMERNRDRARVPADPLEVVDGESEPEAEHDDRQRDGQPDRDQCGVAHDPPPRPTWCGRQ